MNNQKEHWSNKIGAISSILGSAIGLGSLWKLPYHIVHYGFGFYFFVFGLSLFFICVPVFIAECTIGKIGGGGPIKSFYSISKTPFWGSLGLLHLASSLIIIPFYGVICSFVLRFLFLSFYKIFVDLDDNYVDNFFDNVAILPSIYSILYIAFFVIISGIIVAFGIQKGIEKFCSFFGVILLLVLIFMLRFQLTWDSIKSTILFIINIDVSHLNGSLIREMVFSAIGVSLFNMSLSQGIIVTYGSYFNSKWSIKKMAFITALSILFIGLLVCFLMFPLFHTNNVHNTADIGIIFKYIPINIRNSMTPSVFLFLFFVSAFAASITSYIAFLEVCIKSLIEIFNIKRISSAILISLYGITTSSFCILYKNNVLSNIKLLDDITSLFLFPTITIILCCFVISIFIDAKKRNEFVKFADIKNYEIIFIISILSTILFILFNLLY